MNGDKTRILNNKNYKLSSLEKEKHNTFDVDGCMYNVHGCSWMYLTLCS